MNSIELDEFVRQGRKYVAAKGTDYDIAREYIGGYPLWDDLTSECKPSVAAVFEMEAQVGSKVHNVVLAYLGNDDYRIWCGDNFIEGGTTKISTEDRVAMAAVEMTINSQRSLDVMSELVNVGNTSAPCGFWARYRSKNLLCKHCNQLLAIKAGQLEKLKTVLQERFESVIMHENGAPAGQPIPAPAMLRTVAKVPVLMEGEKGWGKSTEARMLADALEAKLIEIQGHESVEASDLTGYTVRHGHDMVWKDGRLSQAFRMAAKGEKVLLLIDELLRIPQRQLSVLLSCLAPYKGQYILSTGRMIDVQDGIGTEETLSCPVGNLYVIATTNVGAQYAVDVIDDALKERFVVVRKTADVEQLRANVLSAATPKGFSAAVADQAVRFYTAMVALKTTGLAADIPNPRTMVRAIELSDVESEVGDSVMLQLLTWVGRDVSGNPIPEQEAAVSKAIRKVWP